MGGGTAKMAEESVKRAEPMFFLNNEIDQEFSTCTGNQRNSSL